MFFIFKSKVESMQVANGGSLEKVREKTGRKYKV